MPITHPDGKLDLELLAPGPNAHGYGRLSDGRDFAFRVRHRKARMEIYREGADGAEPAPADIEAVGELSTGRLNLDSDRSLKILLRTLVAVADTVEEQEQAEAARELPERTLRAYFVRLDAMLDSWAEALAG